MIGKKLEEFFREEQQNLAVKVSRAVAGFPNAEDVVQIAFEKAWKYRHTFNPEISPFDVWFNSILRNAMRDFMEDMRSQGNTVQLDDDLEVDSPEPPLDVSKVTRRIKSRIKKKKDLEQRHILELYFLHGISPKGIKSVVDLNKRTIEQIVYRFKQEVKLV